jgi:tetratricopeptide (TPR) repeat protein
MDVLIEVMIRDYVLKRGMKHSRKAVFLMTVVAVVSLIAFASAQELKPEISTALTNGDTTLAINLLNQEIQIDKAYSFNYYMLGMIYYNQGKYSKAADQFQLALDHKSKDYDALYYQGLCYIELGQLEKAQANMETGVKKDKSNKARFEDGLGQVMLAKKSWQEADRLFRQALVDDPSNANYHIHLGDANFYQGIPSLAITEYEKALQEDTASSEVYYHWAEACLDMKDYKCAIEKLKIVLQKDSTFAKAWMRAGGIYFKAGMSSRTRQDRDARFKEAIGSYKKYLELSKATPDSSNVRVFYELAMSYSNLYGFEDAVDYFREVLAIPMVPRDIYFYYGKALFYTKQYDSSADMLHKQLEWAASQGEDYKSTVDSAEVFQLLGDDYFYKKPKDFTTAIEYYKKSLALKPNQARLLQNVAIGYHSLRSYQQALEYYDKRIALGIDSTSASIYRNAGYAALNIATNSSAGGEEDVDIDQLGDEGAPPPETSTDTANANVDYFKLSTDYLTKYLQFDSTDVKVTSAVAYNYLYKMTDCENGVKYYQKVLELDPGNCEAKKSIGYAYFAGGICTKNYGKALDYLHEAYTCLTKSKGECADPSLTLWIAQCYHLRAAEKSAKKQNANDDFKNAYNWYGKVLKCQPNNAEAKKGQDDTRFEFAN